ncbi:hypothetical protein Ancab_023769 [Ancistrocladus abbreviatus]
MNRIRRNRSPPSHLPPELWNQILLRLPLKTLLKFRSVSRQWLSLIDDPKFVSDYLVQSNREPKDTHLLMMERLSLDESRWTIRRSKTFGESSKLPELNLPCGNFALVGYVNGVLLINLISRKRKLFLCNPSVRKYLELPLTSMIRGVNLVRFGFGFDPSTNVYKIVAMALFAHAVAPRGYFYVVEVYSLSTGSWKRTTEGSPTLSCRGDQVFLNGAIHWIGDDNIRPEVTVFKPRDSKIVSFDVGSEVFNYFSLPNGVNHSTSTDTCLIRFGGVKSYDIQSHQIKDLVKTHHATIIFVEPYVDSLALVRRVEGHEVRSLPLEEREEHDD